MSSDPTEPDSPSQDLRKRLVVRITIAVALLIGAVVGFQWLEATEQPAPQAQVVMRPEAAQSPAALVAGSPQSQAAATATAAQQDPTTTLASSAPGVTDGVRPEPVASTEQPTPPAKSAAQTAAKHAKIPRGPHLQAGVFIQAINAEELKATLEAQGLPVYIESRVQVGPFKDRKEAERMREELKAKGMSTVLIAQ